MRIRSALFALALVPGALAFAVTPADTEETETCTTYSDAGTPDDTSDDIIMCEVANYLSCEDTLDPAGKVHDIQVPVKLTTIAPDTSFTAAGGCGVPEIPLFGGVYQNTPYDFDIAGYTKGNIDTLTFELHDIHATEARQSRTMNLAVRITIDELSPFGSEENTNVSGDPFDSPLTLDIPVEMVDSATGLSDGMFFTVTNLGEDLPELLDAGVGDYHGIKVTIGFDATNATGLQVPVWGATEVPASITVNGEVKGTVVDATAHG